jgi:hypothetical protein
MGQGGSKEGSFIQRQEEETMPLSTNIDICNLAHLSSHKKNETM